MLSNLLPKKLWALLVPFLPFITGRIDLIAHFTSDSDLEIIL